MPYDVKISPSTLEGTCKAPPSKSILHRAIFCAALSQEPTTLTNYTKSNDITASLNAIKALGATYKIKKDTLTITPSTLRPSPKISVLNSASTLRFMIPLAAFLLKEPTTFILGDSLIKRPLLPYQRIFKNQLTFKDNTLTITPFLTPNTITLIDLESSQYITGLLLACPLLKEDTTLIIHNPPSPSYIDLTIDILTHFNITITKTKKGYHIPGNQTYKAKDLFIEGDYSQAAFFLCAGLFHRTITITDLNPNSLQADKDIIKIIAKLNGNITQNNTTVTTIKSPLKPSKIDIDKTPDLAPILALSLCFTGGKSKLLNGSRLQYKESNRLHTTSALLNALGAEIKRKKDTLHITSIRWLQGNKNIPSFNDHRIVMMACIAGTLSLKPILIKDAHVIDKSYPNFFKDLASLGGKIKIIKRKDPNEKAHR